MNYIDIIIVLLVLFFAYKGFKRGLIKELISLIALIAGIYIANHFSVFLEKTAIKYIDRYQEVISVISFIIVFLIIYLSLKVAEIIISKLAKTLKLGIINQSLGFVFGGAKITLILAALLFELNYLEKRIGITIPENQKQTSLLYNSIYKIIPTITPVAKEKMKLTKPIENKIQKIKKDLTN